MFTGSKLKSIRTFRKMTQKQLGLALGYDEKSADIRIAQYESNKRIPKEETLQAMANILNVNILSLRGSTAPYCAEDILSILFELDRSTPIELIDVKSNDPYDTRDRTAVIIDHAILQKFLKEWKIRKQELIDCSITDEEYQEWKLNWPKTGDQCGKSIPEHQWRKNKS